jgi:ubiquinone/menaquinone biosynthesis C-methylase UbiE
MMRGCKVARWQSSVTLPLRHAANLHYNTPMKPNGRFRGTLRYLYAHWPSYAVLYGGLLASLILIGMAADRGWFGLIPLALATFLILGYFITASLWAAYQIYDQIKPHHMLFDMGQLRETDRFTYLGLGLRERVFDLSRRLTTGRILVIDLYNPQWTSGSGLARLRLRARPPLPDPRLHWQTGQVTLLPLPDESVPAVIMCETVSAFWQEGDRLALLKEARRILSKNGRLLMAERTRSRANWLTLGPAAADLETADYWHNLLRQAGFQVEREQALGDLVTCWRADKPTPAQANQLALELGYGK